ncbi:MAG: hypothetical protein ACFE0P_03605 [Oceanicaulis sp.]
MIARRALLAGLGGASAAALFAPPARACSCRFATTPEEIEDQLSDPNRVLFDGVVKVADYPPEGRVIDSGFEASTVFEIVTDWTGQLGSATELEVAHRLHGPACGLKFETGAKVLVLAYRREDGIWRTSLCTMPRPDYAELYRTIAWRRLRGG